MTTAACQPSGRVHDHRRGVDAGRGCSTLSRPLKHIIFDERTPVTLADHTKYGFRSHKENSAPSPTGYAAGGFKNSNS